MNDSRTTPDDLFRLLSLRFGPFQLDAAASESNVKCSKFYTRFNSGLLNPWIDRTWCNPPYSRGNLGLWCKKAGDESGSVSSALLIPAAVGTRWFYEAVMGRKLVILVGRVQFGGALVEEEPTGAKFDSCVALFGPAFRNHPAVSWYDWKRDLREMGK